MDSAYRIELQAGEVLFREGDAPTTAFLIEAGHAAHQHASARATDGARRSRCRRAGRRNGGARQIAAQRDRTALSHCVLTPIDRSQFAERLESCRSGRARAAAQPACALPHCAGDVHRQRAASISGSETAAHADAPHRARQDPPGKPAARRAGSHELEMRLQPILHIASGRIAGFEALTRWHHPERGRCSPAEFIALAEETSLIVPVGEYVLRRSLRGAAQFSPTWCRRSRSSRSTSRGGRSRMRISSSACSRRCARTASRRRSSKSRSPKAWSSTIAPGRRR